MQASTQLVPRQTVQHFCEHRDQTLENFSAAFAALNTAKEALAKAHAGLRHLKPEHYNYLSREDFGGLYLEGIKLPDQETFTKQATRATDTYAWMKILEATDLERLMDKQEKDDLRRQLQQEPPEFTSGSVKATFERMALDAETIFMRGVANVFSQLDRRFRSHNAWKIGSRIILTHAFCEWGSWNYHRNHRDTIKDIERAFFILDGEEQPPEYAGIVGVIDNERKKGSGARQDECESEYFKARCFKNGNLHLWFKRDDLLKKVNLLLAEYYGETLAHDEVPEDDGGLFTPKTTLAKNYGFFPTPESLVDRVYWNVHSTRRNDAPVIEMLEPSAGTGNLARRAVQDGCLVDCVEIQPDLAHGLTVEGIYRDVIKMDFLSMKPTKLYDIIIMNPPFDRERDIDHVIHAMKFLKPGGQLTAIMSAGTEFRETRKSIAFRAHMKKLGADWSDLPPGSFSSVGTNVNTLLLQVTV